MKQAYIGRVFGGRFRVAAEIGAGAMGAVYRARDTSTGDPVALKLLHPHLLSSPDFVARFRREAHAANRFRHENAVRILATGETEDVGPFIAMEFCEGESLQTVIDRDAPLPSGRACRIAVQILSVLDEAHSRGIIHRDLKPDNIVVATDEAGGETVKVLDFGVAKVFGAGVTEGAFRTKTGTVFGTPRYMSPEQASGDVVDGRTDLYSLGAMLYEMLTASPPLDADDIGSFLNRLFTEDVTPMRELAPELGVPPRLDLIVTGLLAKDREERPSPAKKVARSLRAYASDPGVLRETTRRAKRSSRRRQVAIAAVLLLLAGMSVLLLPPGSGEMARTPGPSPGPTGELRPVPPTPRSQVESTGTVLVRCPVPGARVLIEDGSGNPIYDGRLPEGGSLRAEVRIGRDHVLRVLHPRYDEFTTGIEVVEGSTLVVDAELVPGAGAISVRGPPESRLIIRRYGDRQIFRRARLDETGIRRLANLDPGLYSVELEADGGSTTLMVEVEPRHEAFVEFR